jgi:hypothetical protein
LSGGEAGVWATATPAMNRLINKKRKKNFFITRLLGFISR